MAADVAILIGTLTLGLATSVVGACLYLNRSEIAERWRSMMPGGNKIADPQSMLEQTYADLQHNLMLTRQQIESSLSAQDELAKQMLLRQEKLNRLEARAADKKNIDASIPDAIGKKQQEIKELEEQLAQQKRHTQSLEQQQADLQEAVINAYTQKQVLITRKNLEHVSRAEMLIGTTSPKATIASLAKLEADVAAREAEALGFINRLSKLFSQDAIKELDKEELDHMVPILPHAVEQLGKAIDQIVEAEGEVEKRIEKNREWLRTWTHRAEMAIQQNNNDLAKQSLQRAKQYAAAVDLLEAQLELMRQHNGELRKTQADFESMVEKLSVRIAEMKGEDASTSAEEKAPNSSEDAGKE